MHHHAVGVCMIYMVPFFLHFSSLLLTDPISRHDVALKQSSLPHWSSLPPSFYPLLWSIDHAWQSIMRAHWCFLPIKLSFFLLRSAHIIHQKTIFDWFLSHFFLLSFSVDLISLQLRSRPLQDIDLFLSLLSSSRPSLSTIWFTLYIYIYFAA